MMKRIFLSILFLLVVLSLFASSEAFKAPEILSVESSSSDKSRMTVHFSFETVSGGGEKAIVKLYDENLSLVETKTVGKSRKAEKKAIFTPSASGTYIVEVVGVMGDEEKSSERKEIYWSYPLLSPVISATNMGEGFLRIEWNAIHEAEKYLVTIDGEEYSTTDTFFVGGPYGDGEKHSIAVESVRGEERVSSSVMTKTSRMEKDRKWYFARFGQSTKDSLNTYEILDSDKPVIKLNSCLVASDGSVSEKGGKFTSFHDGISYYYTVISPDMENFSLTATFTVDYINPSPDGQEGFGIVAMDKLGENGVSSVNHYTSSFSLIATKFEGWVGNTKYSSKDTLGSRSVTGITDDVLKGGDDAIAREAKVEAKAFSYQKEDLIKTGEKYVLTLSLDNTGFHAMVNGEEHILYGGRDLLRVLDKDHIYVGFAVARGCNVTVSDISLTVTDPKTDPEGKEAPPELVPYSLKIDSPSSSSSSLYRFAFTSLSPGKAEVLDRNTGETVLSSFPVSSSVTVSGFIPLKEGNNDFTVVFTPSPLYKPYSGAVMARWEGDRLVESNDEISLDFSVEMKALESKLLYVSPEGKDEGDGTRDNPLSLSSAIRFSSPGTTIILLPGVYRIQDRIRIERGNSGTRNARKVLKGEGEVVLDFSSSPYGMELWGDWWILSSFTVSNTIDGKKGLQIAGSHNRIEYIEAEYCGDTGIQISGSSSESRDKWPRYNTVYGCISHDNADSAMNNADGFAAKLTVGEGNVFSSCVAYNNADDGWDLFSKIETGPIGEVTVEKCVAYGNGALSDGRSGGDGNGFKLGGDGISVRHILRDSIAFRNLSNGVTSNSNPSVIVENVVCWNNWGSNLTLYGKGGGERDFSLNGFLSLSGGSSDNISEMPSLLSENTFLWDGEKSSNLSGVCIGEDIFLSTSFSGFSITDVGVDMGDFLFLTDCPW